MRAATISLILTTLSLTLLAQSGALSYLQTDRASNKTIEESDPENNPFEPDSADYAKAAIVADDLLYSTVKKLHILSNIDKNAAAISYFDKIITFDNEVLIVKVQHITLTEVSFLYPFNTRIETINRQKVSQILYADNRIDLFTPFEEEKKKLLPVQEDRLIVYRRELWERIMITENENDINGFQKVKHLTVVFEADRINCNHKYLERNGMIRLKKRAAGLQADMVLITNKSVHRGYGDFPNIKIEGIAYKK
jgi:hypothetical protein